MKVFRATLAVGFASITGFIAAPAAPAVPQRPSTLTAKPVEFFGLRRVPEATARARMPLSPGGLLRAADLRAAVARLDQSGWFESIAVQDREDAFAFVVVERRFLIAVSYPGSRRFTRDAIESSLDAAGVLPRPARAIDPHQLHRAARLIKGNLRETGHWQARVEVFQEAVGPSAARVRFQIHEGPLIPVQEVRIAGASPQMQPTLRGELKDVNPQAWLAGLRRKNVYSAERMAADAQRLERRYHALGYPFARVGSAQVRVATLALRRWFPWPGKVRRRGLLVTLPVEEGPRIQWDSFAVFDCAGQSRDELLLSHRSWKPGALYSGPAIEDAREYLAGTLRCPEGVPAQISATPQFDRASGTAHVTFRARPAVPFQIRRIEFAGHRRFPERFYRNRLQLREGDDWLPEKLSDGLLAISRDGFVKPISQVDVETRFDYAARTVDVRVRVTEAGRQRISLVGGASTIGIAYNLFHLFGGEELITGHLEGGPPALHFALGVAREGLLGNRAAAGLSFFHKVLRPRLPGTRRERLFTSTTAGITQSFAFLPSPQQAIALRYQFASSTLEVPGQANGAAPATSHTSSSEVAANWQGILRGTRFTAEAIASGGALGGAEELVGASASATRRFSASPQRGEFAARVQSSAVAPAPWARTQAVPVQSRLYPGADWVRGMRPGELLPRGATAAAGVTLLHGGNLEYAHPLDAGGRVQLSGFADGALGWLRPDAASVSRPATRVSLGLEIRWQLPESSEGTRFPLAGETLRLHYAFAPWLGSAGRRTVLGWALGSFF